jgi:murein DD-endopeptidase MepM/ murein hydrolase activator NlpD
MGAPIIAAGAGRIMHRYNSGFGNHQIIDHGGLFTLYAHQPNGGFRTTDGQHVDKGQRIGTVGNTGRSYGAHLHFETHVGGLNWNNPGTHMNPRDFMARYAG